MGISGLAAHFFMGSIRVEIPFKSLEPKRRKIEKLVLRVRIPYVQKWGDLFF